MADLAVLDNPVWFSLGTGHRAMARSRGAGRRYPNDASPLAGMAEPTAAGFADLLTLVAPGEVVALFTREPVEVPGEWEVKHLGWLEQMTCAGVKEAPRIELAALGRADVPEMLVLTALTEPGPFLQRTIEMGRYFGIRAADGRLAAMAGERLRPDGFTEVSAVCTHPDFRGRGYGSALVAHVAHVAGMAMRESRAPFLHVKPENPAKAVYRKVGFEVRRALRLTVVSRV